MAHLPALRKTTDASSHVFFLGLNLKDQVEDQVVGQVNQAQYFFANFYQEKQSYRDDQVDQRWSGGQGDQEDK